MEGINELQRRRGDKLYREGQAIVARLPRLNPLDDEGIWESKISDYPKRMFIWGLLNLIFVENGEENPLVKVNSPPLESTIDWYKRAIDFEASAAWDEFWE
jgi:hypothetical protein